MVDTSRLNILKGGSLVNINDHFGSFFVPRREFPKGKIESEDIVVRVSSMTPIQLNNASRRIL